MAESALTPEVAGEPRAETRPLLSVVVPVYRQPEIVENVRTIRERIEAKLGEPIELIVVSDGSDQGEEAMAESGLARVIHYDRNLGKGYAVKTGALAARGRFIAYVDADLDLDPGSIPRFLELAQREELDFVIGSKRHPDSLVHYPRSRRAGSWLYQQLVRVLFRLNVRDTQVGMKVFRREVAEEVLPLLVVKQFAFDLEFLAVARALGYGRIREEPVTLQYQFTGSGVRSAAVLHALIDTAAIFYRLRILRYYQRKQELLPAYARVQDYQPRVSLVGPAPAHLDYPNVELIETAAEAPETRAEALRRAEGEIVAFLAPDAAPAANWLDATVRFLANPRIAAVVTPSMTTAQGTIRERAASALQESFLGGGSHYFRFTPGNLRFVRQFPGVNLVARRDYCLELPEPDLHPDRICAALAGRGRLVLYTPETVVVAPRPPLFWPHLENVQAQGLARAQEIRHHGLRGVTLSSLPPVALLAFTLFGWPLILLGGGWRTAWTLVVGGYFAIVLLGGAWAALRFRSVRVGAVAAIASVAVHFTYGLSLVRGLFQR